VRRADLNALWYHALVAMAQLARLTGRKESGAFYLAWARDHQLRFNAALWDEERGCLHPALGVHGPEHGATPGQLLAVSLPPALLPPERAARLVATIERELVTAGGLRERADAPEAHTEWLGHYLSAHLRVHQRDAASRARARGWYERVAAALDRGVAGYVGETLEGGSGAPVSVVATAELLRVWVEEMDHAGVAAPVA